SVSGDPRFAARPDHCTEVRDMKFRITFAALAFAASPALAQPLPQPPPQPPPGPPPPEQPQNPESPTWLPGVQNVTGAEPAVPGKLTLPMARAVELAEKTQPALRQARAPAEAATGRTDLARVPLHPTVTVAATAGVGSSLPHTCPTDMTLTCGGF